LVSLNNLVQRTTQILGKEAKDLILESAFEYQQDDFHYFIINKVKGNEKVRNVVVSNENGLDQVIETFNKL
jgi:hypothetical protein